MRRGRGKIVSFRVAEEHYDLLVARSANGGSPGSCARELMLQALHAEPMAELKSRLDEQQLSLDQLQSSQIRMFRAALIIFGKFGTKQAVDLTRKILGDALNCSNTR